MIFCRSRGATASSAFAAGLAGWATTGSSAGGVFLAHPKESERQARDETTMVRFIDSRATANDSAWQRDARETGIQCIRVSLGGSAAMLFRSLPALALIACAVEPSYEGRLCSAERGCPRRYECGADDRCHVQGSLQPDAQPMEPDGGNDAGSVEDRKSTRLN